MEGHNMCRFTPMSIFEKMCAALAILLGIVFLILGVFGLFLGAKAHFTLPPILGALPFFIGYGICIPLIRYWKMSNDLPMENSDTDSHWEES